MTAFRGFVRDLIGLPPAPPQPPAPRLLDEGTCQIDFLGIAWFVEYAYDDDPNEDVSIEECCIRPDNPRLQCDPIPISFSELPNRVQEQIEDSARRDSFERRQPGNDVD